MQKENTFFNSNIGIVARNNIKLTVRSTKLVFDKKESLTDKMRQKKYHRSNTIEQVPKNCSLKTFLIYLSFL